jgi:hypothetical protein
MERNIGGDMKCLIIANIKGRIKGRITLFIDLDMRFYPMGYVPSHTIAEMIVNRLCDLSGQDTANILSILTFYTIIDIIKNINFVVI